MKTYLTKRINMHVVYILVSPAISTGLIKQFNFSSDIIHRFAGENIFSNSVKPIFRFEQL